jgi:hypothetical protein
LRILRAEELENVADGEANSFDRSGSSFSQEVLEFGEYLLDRVEVGEYLGRKKSLAPTERMS